MRTPAPCRRCGSQCFRARNIASLRPAVKPAAIGTTAISGASTSVRIVASKSSRLPSSGTASAASWTPSAMRKALTGFQCRK
jgi:hypothetical protein